MSFLDTVARAKSYLREHDRVWLLNQVCHPTRDPAKELLDAQDAAA